MRRVPSSVLRSAAASAVLALALTGCGSSSKPGTAPASAAPTTTAPSIALTKAQAKTALITDAQIGSGFKVDTTPDDDTAGPGCLKDVDDASQDAPVKATRAYSATAGFPFVNHEIDSYDSVEEADTAFKAVREALTTCTSVDATDTDGIGYKLAISADDRDTFKDGDDQLNVVQKGSITEKGQTTKVYITMIAVRAENTITAIVVVDQGESPTPGISTLFDQVAERLVAVNNGKDPDAA